MVVRTVDQHGGRVKLAGEEWSAQSFDPLQVLPVGKTVQVMEITRRHRRRVVARVTATGERPPGSHSAQEQT